MHLTRFIGCMTGTSCDGLDISYIETDGKIITKFGPSKTFKFSDALSKILKERIALGVKFHTSDMQISNIIAEYHIECIQQFINENKLIVDAIGMHGQTVWHNPDDKISIQLGNAKMVANALKIPVVAQFRQNDLKNGGQGAPLVPIYHKALAISMSYPIAFINIGGVSNITFINKEELIAGDIGPGNALIDDWMLKNTGVAFDENGTTALSGKIQEDILQKWQQDTFFKKPLPKSLDRQYFHSFLKDVEKLSITDGAATLTALTCFSITNALKSLPKCQKIIICGGGRHNQFIMKQLEKTTENVVGSEIIGINPDDLEAQMIAYLTARFFYKLPSSFPKTTDVNSASIAGELFHPL
jgi:anhydro-N-acetylmuramic acid kinase